MRRRLLWRQDFKYPVLQFRVSRRGWRDHPSKTTSSSSGCITMPRNSSTVRSPYLEWYSPGKMESFTPPITRVRLPLVQVRTGTIAQTTASLEWIRMTLETGGASTLWHPVPAVMGELQPRTGRELQEKLPVTTQQAVWTDLAVPPLPHR